MRTKMTSFVTRWVFCPSSLLCVEGNRPINTGSKQRTHRRPCSSSSIWGEASWLGPLKPSRPDFWSTFLHQTLKIEYRKTYESAIVKWFVLRSIGTVSRVSHFKRSCTTNCLHARHLRFGRSLLGTLPRKQAFAFKHTKILLSELEVLEADNQLFNLWRPWSRCTETGRYRCCTRWRSRDSDCWLISGFFRFCERLLIEMGFRLDGLILAPHRQAATHNMEQRKLVLDCFRLLWLEPWVFDGRKCNADWVCGF